MLGTVIQGTTTAANYLNPYQLGVANGGDGSPGCNVFEGQIQSTGGSGSNSVVWLGVPIDAPGTLTHRIIRVANIRANAAGLGVSSTFIPTQIIEFISITGASSSATAPQSISITNPQFTVGFILPGLKSSLSTANLLQCNSVNTTLLGESPGNGTDQVFAVTITEGFATAFKPRVYPYVTGVAPTVAGGFPNPSATTQYQNVEGFTYNSESGFYNPAVTGNVVGLADTGTRLQVVFNNVNNGVSVFVPNVVPLSGGAAGLGEFLILVSPTQGTAATITGTNTTGSPSTGLTVTGGSATAVYEVLNADPAAVKRQLFRWQWHLRRTPTRTCQLSARAPLATCR
jgi:hypothetical protein